MTLGQLMSLVTVAGRAEGKAAPKTSQGSIVDLAMLARMKAH